jgi:hypothetical protein
VRVLDKKPASAGFLFSVFFSRMLEKKNPASPGGKLW